MNTHHMILVEDDGTMLHFECPACPRRLVFCRGHGTTTIKGDQSVAHVGGAGPIEAAHQLQLPGL